MLHVQAFPSGPFETNAYIIWCSETRECAFVDPAPGSTPLLSGFVESQKLIPRMILLTHSHWDHIADVAPLSKRYPIPIAVHELDKENLQTPGSDRLPCWITIEGVQPHSFLQEGDHIRLGDEDLEVIHTPGHTPGSVCFYNQEGGNLLSGDTLFRGSIGNLSFPTSQPDKMWPSLDKLAKLPPQTRVFPGHGNSTTIGTENWLPRARDIFDR